MFPPIGIDSGGGGISDLGGDSGPAVSGGGQFGFSPVFGPFGPNADDGFFGSSVGPSTSNTVMIIGAVALAVAITGAVGLLLWRAR